MEPEIQLSRFAYECLSPGTFLERTASLLGWWAPFIASTLAGLALNQHTTTVSITLRKLNLHTV